MWTTLRLCVVSMSCSPMHLVVTQLQHTFFATNDNVSTLGSLIFILSAVSVYTVLSFCHL